MKGNLHYLYLYFFGRGESGGKEKRNNWSAENTHYELTDPFTPEVLLNSSQVSLVITLILSEMLPTLSNAGRTSSENTGDPSGRGGAE